MEGQTDGSSRASQPILELALMVGVLPQDTGGKERESEGERQGEGGKEWTRWREVGKGGMGNEVRKALQR